MTYDVVIVGTSFASSFFLLELLDTAAPGARILVLERGKEHSHRWQVENRKHSELDGEQVFLTPHDRKPWITHIGFGGNSNCWWACTPRMMPRDFSLRSHYGVGVDWPLSYGDLEDCYDKAEAIMSVSGPSDGSPFPRSSPYPQPPHRFTEPDKLLKRAYPDAYFQQPTARARTGTLNRRACCATGVCHLCPVDAKFTIQNELHYLYRDHRVTLSLNSDVRTIETRANTALGVRYVKGEAEYVARGDLIVLGANALFNPYILLRSGVLHPLLGKYLNEQVSVTAEVDLDGVDNFQGSTSITGHGYMLYDGEHRRERAACLIEAFNIPRLRPEEGKWRQCLQLKFIFEDIPNERNFVSVSSQDSRLPETVYEGWSEYTQRAIRSLDTALPGLLEPLPVERVVLNREARATEGHIQGTTVMGRDPARSVVDRHLMHHGIRNLLVLGSGAFPTCPPANPTLTLAALSIWAARAL